MATNNLDGMYGVRNELNARGISNDRIGWNKNTGYVQIDGQNFLKPPTVDKGVSYADPTSFDQSYNVWNTQNKLNTAQNNYEQQLTQPVANPYDQQVNDVLSQFYNQMMNPTPYDPYSSDEYRAYQAQAQRGAQQSIRAAQESMGAANFGRSTNLTDRAQGIQNNANEYMELQVVPQLRAAHQQQQQQQLANLGSYLDALSGQQGLFDTRTQRGLDNTMSYLNLLSGQRGQFVDEQYRTNRDNVIDNQWQQNFDRGAFESDRQFDRGVLEFDKNFDRGVLESDRNFNEGVRQYDLNSKRQEEQWQAQFDEDRRQFGLSYALQQDANRRAAASASNSANRAVENDRLNNLYKVWEATGYAPKGIPEVEEGTPLAQSGTSRSNYNYKSDPDFTAAIKRVNENPTYTLSLLDQDPQYWVNLYGYDGYNELRRIAVNRANAREE